MPEPSAEQPPEPPAESPEDDSPREKAGQENREHAVDPADIRKRVETSYDEFGDDVPDKLSALKDEMVRRLARVGAENASIAEGLKEHLAGVALPGEDGVPLTKEEALSAISEAISEYFDANFTEESLEELSRRSFVRESGFTELSKLLSFNAHGKDAHIHLAPGRTMNPKALIRDVRSGLEELAKRLETDEELKDVETINATSWIVAKHPELLERLGFTIDGKIGKELQDAHFSEEMRDVWGSHISKEDLIARYGGEAKDDTPPPPPR